jgi:uncharacterized protein (TIGR00255 family)
MDKEMKILKSMTGFAAVQKNYNESEVSCEIRSLNSRFLEISLRTPRILNDLESTIKEIIRQKITRGKIMYSLNFSSLNNDVQSLKIQTDSIKAYKNLLQQMKKEAGIRSPIQLEHLLYFKDIISLEESAPVDEALSRFVFELTEETLDGLNKMRYQEGQFLNKDLEDRLAVITRLTEEVSHFAADNPKTEFEKLYQRLISLIDQDQVDKNRLELELALIADRVDITEEVVRLKSHIKLFQDDLKAGSPIGKKLNFILQEMNRETNTMSNKSTMVEIAHRVVQLKEEIEKVREQVQNIE